MSQVSGQSAVLGDLGVQTAPRKLVLHEETRGKRRERSADEPPGRALVHLRDFILQRERPGPRSQAPCPSAHSFTPAHTRRPFRTARPHPGERAHWAAAAAPPASEMLFLEVSSLGSSLPLLRSTAPCLKWAVFHGHSVSPESRLSLIVCLISRLCEEYSEPYGLRPGRIPTESTGETGPLIP